MNWRHFLTCYGLSHTVWSAFLRDLLLKIQKKKIKSLFPHIFCDFFNEVDNDKSDLCYPTCDVYKNFTPPFNNTDIKETFSEFSLRSVSQG